MPEHVTQQICIGRDNDRVVALKDAEHPILSIGVANDGYVYVPNFFLRKLAAFLLSHVEHFVDQFVSDRYFITLIDQQQKGRPPPGPRDDCECHLTLWKFLEILPTDPDFALGVLCVQVARFAI